MAGYVLVGALAAFGAFSVLWAMLGWLLPAGQEEVLVLPGRKGKGALPNAGRYLWLRGLGLLKCPMVMADAGLSDREKVWLEHKGIEICSLAELSERLGIGAEST